MTRLISTAPYLLGDMTLATPRKSSKLRNGVIFVLAVAVALAVSFTVFGLFNEQAVNSPTLFFSMLMTTFPLMAMIIIGVFFIFRSR